MSREIECANKADHWLRITALDGAIELHTRRENMSEEGAFNAPREAFLNAIAEECDVTIIENSRGGHRADECGVCIRAAEDRKIEEMAKRIYAAAFQNQELEPRWDMTGEYTRDTYRGIARRFLAGAGE